MAEVKSTRHSGKEWTEDDVKRLRELTEGNTPAGVMSLKLVRSEDSVRAEAQAEGIWLSPSNRPPYGTVS